MAKRNRSRPTRKLRLRCWPLAPRQIVKSFPVDCSVRHSFRTPIAPGIEPKACSCLGCFRPAPDHSGRSSWLEKPKAKKNHSPPPHWANLSKLRCWPRRTAMRHFADHSGPHSWPKRIVPPIARRQQTWVYRGWNRESHCSSPEAQSLLHSAKWSAARFYPLRVCR